MKTTYYHDVFVSHCACDKSKARKIAECLRERGLRVWFDDWSIPVGADIAAAVEAGLQGSRTLLLCLSKNSLNSDWVEAERSTALFRDPMNRDRRFIPALIDDCQEIIPDVLKRFRYADLRNHTAAELEELCKACSPPKDKVPTPQWHLKIEGDLQDFDKQRLDRILDQLRNLSGDIDVVLRRIDPSNSVRITLDGSLAGFDKLRELFIRGDLSSLLDEEVLSIEVDGAWTTDDIDRTIPTYEFLDLASEAYQRRRYDEALKYYNSALELARQIEFLKPIGSIYCNIGFIYENQGELTESIQMHRKAIEADERTENKLGLSNHCYNLGRIYSQLDEREISRHYYERALELARELDDRKRVDEIESVLGIGGDTWETG